jgi:hexosaminidase
MKYTILFAVLSLALAVSSCDQQVSISRLDEAGIIPLPSSIKNSTGDFVVDAEAAIQLKGSGDELTNVGDYLASKIRPSSGFEIPVSKESGNIILELKSGEASEGYELIITKDDVTVSSTSAAGLFYGVQTLIQVFPFEIENQSKVVTEWILPAGTIIDEPEFAYRAAMLDVARHFYPVKNVKQYIDELAVLKFNYLHLHLSDDQGWRIEIKSWPKLTEIGSTTEVGGTEGGFFTQDEYKEIVAYAAKNFITIIPEIDMPGHTNAALSSYGELNPGVNLPDGDFSTMKEGKIDFDILDGNPVAAEIYTGIEVGFSTLATNKELTYQFVDDVIREISAITPGPYFHIGGDESHVTEKDDYIYFVERAQGIASKYNKISIGWDEIANTKLLPGSIAQFWAVEENAKLAKEQGNQIIMSPAKKSYLDMQYDSTTRVGLHWAAFIELDDAYNWDPSSYVEGINKTDILGVEAPIWTETLDKWEDVQYLVFPRISALAEVAWSTTGNRNWESYQKRVAQMGKRWEIKGIQFYKSPKVEW